MPSDSAKKWVEYLGDVDNVLQMAKADFDKGEYQWVAEVTNTIVFADRRTPMHGFCAPMHWSSWGIRRSPARGATNI